MLSLRLIVIPALALVSGTVLATGQPRILSAAEIVERLQAANGARAASLAHYDSTRVYEVTYKGFPGDRQARMVVALSYDNPGQKTFKILSEEGSKVLLDRVLHKALESEQEAANQSSRSNTELNAMNYDFELAGFDTVEGRGAYILRVTPKKANKFLYDGKVWIDAAEFAIVRIDAKPAKNPSIWISRANIQHTNGKHGDFWLPLRNESRSHTRFGGDALLTIDYSGYVIKADSSATRKKAAPITPSGGSVHTQGESNGLLLGEIIARPE